LQNTGSFKERGALNAILQLSKDKKKRGIIAASAGNHALALAYHGSRLNVPVTVVMPTHAPQTKVSLIFIIIIIIWLIILVNSQSSEVLTTITISSSSSSFEVIIITILFILVFTI
jgi:tryptophan synthase beta subunit